MPVDEQAAAHSGEHSMPLGSSRSSWLIALVFVTAVISMQWGWSQARGTALEVAVIDVATVGTSVAVINTLTPEVRASGVGPRIRSSGGGINILNGCEGTEVLFLLLAALLAFPMSWRWRGVGLLGGFALVFVLNQMRLLALFYSYRHDRALFDHLHGLVAPMALIVITVAFFMLLTRWDHRDKQLGNTR